MKAARKQRPSVRISTRRAKAVASGTGAFGPSWSGANAQLYPVTPDTSQRGWRPDLDRDVASLIPRYKQRAMLSDARYVYTGLGQVSGAVRDKANFAVGSAWVPVYLGKDRRFRDAFNEVITNWMRNCCVRGSLFNWQSSVWLASVSLDRDGEVFILTALSEQGSPRLQFLEAHRIGSDYVDEVPKDAPVPAFYKGRRICNGIVYDDFMRPLGYNILPATEYWGTAKTTWNIVDAASVIHVMDPQWFSQGRGIPTLCNGILDWYDIGESRDAEKIGNKARSRLILAEHNETGAPDRTRALMDARSTGDPTKAAINSTLIENGLIRYFKAGSGGKIEGIDNNKPGSAWIDFIEHIGRSAHRGMDWPYEMHDWSKVGGAAIRAVVGQVQRSIRNRQDALWTPMLSALLYAVSVYINRKQIPLADDWFNIEFRMPPLFSVDVGRDSQNRRQDVAMGLRGVEQIFGEEGEGDVETVFQRRADTHKKLMEVAERNGVPPEAIYNPSAASQQALMSLQGPQQPQTEKEDEE